MQLIPIFITLFLAASTAYAQTSPCGNVASTIASQVTEMNAFNNRVPAPSHTSFTDCTTAKNLKSGIDAYRTAEISDPADGCAGLYANAVLLNGQFNPAYTTLGKFVASC
ncbi:hypothetical protein C8R44DRAFT_864332 [Mycena epipterygia]|nr:hypothetical protein C8R44DRAFT_864332 [Mycena epipterygia]